MVTVLAITFVIFRFAVRLFIVKKMTIDNVLASDVLASIALATLITMAGLYVQIVPVMFDLDLAAAERPLLSSESMLEFKDRADRYLRIQFGIIILFWTCVWAVKLSILIFYKSLFDRLSRVYLYAWWAVVAFVALSYVGCWVLQFLSCKPLGSYFNIGPNSTFAFSPFLKLTSAGHCIRSRDVEVSNASLYYSTAVDVACDLLSKCVKLSMDTSKSLNLADSLI